MSEQAPRTALERALLSRYYGADAMTSADTSSHWRAYGKLFEAGEDAGRLHVKGEGFGNMAFDGRLHAWFDAATRLVHEIRLTDLSDLTTCWHQVRSLAIQAGVDPTFDVFRQACTAAFLSPKIGDKSPTRVLLIGDGYGLLGALLKRRYPAAQIVYVDLGRTLLFQVHHVGRACSEASQALLAPATSWPSTDFVYCPSEHKTLLEAARFDLAVNVASMQEMAPEVVAEYFALLRRVLQPDNLFYCCNRERKVMPGGEVSEFNAYPWEAQDRIWCDEPCPWHQFYLSPRALDRSGALPLPFVQRYDGAHKHRLVTMATGQ
jgi:SAM-dependent methyltransferase